MGRQKAYKGILAKPLLLPGSKQSEASQQIGLLERLFALRDFFGAAAFDKGGDGDLVLALAIRHEAEFQRSQRLSDLFAKYSVEPNLPSSLFLLLVKLCFAHVPGFQLRTPVVSKGRFTDIELAMLFISDCAIRTVSPNASRRSRASVLLSRNKLAKYLGPVGAAPVVAILQMSGNVKQGVTGPVKTLSHTAVRDLLADFSTAVSQFSQGKANEVQTQLVLRVFPMLGRNYVAWPDPSS